MDLSDDCLLEIFKNLPIHDLLAVRITHRRFILLADYLFTMNFRTFDFTDDVLIPKLLTVDRTQLNKLLLRDAEVLLRHVGRFIRTLTINCDSFNPSITQCSLLSLINKYCKRTLKDLRIFKFTLEDKTIDRYSDLFTSLDKFTLHECHTDDWTLGKCLNFCESLKELRIVRVTGVLGFFLLRVSSDLECFMLKSMTSFEQKYISALFQNNASSLRTVKIIDCHLHGRGLYQSMPRFLLGLETLYIQASGLITEDQSNGLLKLENLQHLDVDIGMKNLPVLLDKLAQHGKIKSVGIAVSTLDRDSCNALKRLNLKLLKLTLKGKLSEGCARDLVSDSELETLHLVQCNSMTLDDIVDFIANARYLQDLLINECKELKFFRQEDFSSLVNVRRELSVSQTIRLWMKLSAVKRSKRLIDCDLMNEFQSVIRFRTLSKDEFYEIHTDHYVDEHDTGSNENQVTDLLQLFRGSYDDHFFPGFYLSDDS